MKVIAMVPARLGSQRLKKKNLQLLKGQPLIVHAIRKAMNTQMFDEVWVNSESKEIGEIAISEGANFHERPEELSNNQATSEDFVYEFLTKHSCDYLVQIHSIAPLLKGKEIRDFTTYLKKSQPDVLLSVENIQIECSFKNSPVNFDYSKKTNSQDLEPIQRITWSITGWNRDKFLHARQNNKCSTYFGNVDYFQIGKMAAHVIKTKEDLMIAEGLFDLVHND